VHIDVLTEQLADSEFFFGLHADFSGFTVRTGTIAGALQE